MRELIAEHKPHIDKMNKTGPQLVELSPSEGQPIKEKYQTADRLYSQLKVKVKHRAAALDEAISKSTQVKTAMHVLSLWARSLFALEGLKYIIFSIHCSFMIRLTPCWSLWSESPSASVNLLPFQWRWRRYGSRYLRTKLWL